MTHWKTRALIQASKYLLEVCTDSTAYVCGQSLDKGGWLDIYTHEPLDRLKKGVREIVGIIEPYQTEETRDWEWRLFSREGGVVCYSDGRELDADDHPIVGTDALS